MGLKATLQTFAPLIKNARRMTVPAKDLNIIGLFEKKAEAAAGDIFKFTAGSAKQADFSLQSAKIMTSKNIPLSSAEKKWFSSSYEEFKTYALKRISEYRGLVPENLYNAVEKSAACNEFELTKAMNEYYAKLKDCKTIEEVAKMYPELEHLNIDFAKQLKNRIKISIPENICKEAMQFTDKKEQLEYLMRYFDASRPCIKQWQNYPEILKIQREIANEITEGMYSGASKVDNSWLFGNKEGLSNYLLNNENRDKVLLSYLKQYYFEGKPLQEITPQIIKNRAISPVSLNEDFRFTNKHFARFKSAVSTIDNEAKGYKSIPELATPEADTAILAKAWKSSCLRLDIANETKYGKGWTNVRNILYKRKGVTNYMNSSDEMINRFLLNRFKTNNRVVKEKNPFLKYENLEENITERVKNFVNNRYYTKGSSYSDKAIIESTEFQKFKSQFDIEGMKASIEKVENHYLNIFFKMFWTDSRKARLSDALKEAYGTLQKNIELRDELLMQALSEGIV